ncbi:alanyl-trna synthetase [Holotrichia oblita]|nr:alanyl-trna synthetase [Holotrichia oblita]
MEIPADRLYVSIYLDDDEAFDIWHKDIGLSPDRIVRLGKEDNFWEVGLGPCGPDSEIHFDRGSEYGCGKPDCKPGCDCDRFTEVWNLVFTQFNKEEDGSYSNLSHPNIDTGMGLERIACVSQGVNTLFDVDTIRAIRDKICNIAGITYGANTKNDISVRIITDHIRSVTFMTADGVLPSNEGRGYVLRRLLRRAVRHGKLLGIDGTFMPGLSEVVIEVSNAAYPELSEKKDYILKVVSVEESKFNETIDAGTDILKSYIQKMKAENKTTLSGSEAFKLYDTYGFPVELMSEILEEAGVGIDLDGFNTEMENQRVRARSARGESDYMGADETVFNTLDISISSEYAGYNVLNVENAKIIALIVGGELKSVAETGDEAAIILDKTPFYAESGGQKGDKGIIRTASGRMDILDCKKVVGNKIAHFGTVLEGCIKADETAYAEVNESLRMSTARNHTATHLLQHALRVVLGNHVEQAGSSVDSERLRFDFTHFAPMTPAK